KGSAKLLWVMWGADLYHYIPLNLCDNYTTKLMAKLDNKIISMLLKSMPPARIPLKIFVICATKYCTCR
ncbi:MAG: hypothetical protein KAS17_08600, partial [Victivallaceae bacterium]|nr:hypothetical protein [Victivallaceae bacterium]